MNIRDWKIEMAKYLGFIYLEENVILQDCRSYTIISKNPIVVEVYESNGKKYKYLGRVEPSSPEKWNSSKLDLWDNTIFWTSENEGKYRVLENWNPDTDWNDLMEIVNKIGMQRVSSDIKETFEDVCKSINYFVK